MSIFTDTGLFAGFITCAVLATFPLYIGDGPLPFTHEKPIAILCYFELYVLTFTSN